MTKGSTIGTIAVLALTGGIAFRATQSPAPPAPSLGVSPALIGAGAGTSPSEPQGDRDQGPCQVIRDFLDHREETSGANPVSGQLTFSGDRGRVDLSFGGQQERKNPQTACG